MDLFVRQITPLFGESLWYFEVGWVGGVGVGCGEVVVG